MKTLPLTSNKITGGFWRQRIDNVVNEVIPYQWKALNDQIPGAEPSHAVENFRIASGQTKGIFYGLIFQDSDIGKWIEAASYGLIDTPNPALEETIDGMIELIGLSQEPDGYLDTYFSMTVPDKKWSDFAMGHEMYCGGHLLEGAIAYFQATGKRSFLDIMVRYVDHLDHRFGNTPGKTVAFCGHPEIELALHKLFELTGNSRYRDLALFFVEERGRHPEVIDNGKVIHWGGGGPALNPWHQKDYYQDHTPVRDQAHADGHSVRAMYLFCAMADQWRLTGDETLGIALRRLWESTVEKRMYVTGGLGSQGVCERFTIDYDLPSDTAYAETCAAIGLIFWAWRMTLVSPLRTYAETLERALYNGALSGISLDGTRYFYVNPLEVTPSIAHARKDHEHIKTERVQWFGCACCPPNIARLITSVAQFMYSHNEQGLWVHQFAESKAEVVTLNGRYLLTQTTGYPWDGNVRIRIDEVSGSHGAQTIFLRIPSGAENPLLTVNSIPRPMKTNSAGYAEVIETWTAGDIIDLAFEMPVRFIRSNPRVKETTGLIAIQKGPFVFCAEQMDNGPDLHLLRVDVTQAVQIESIENLGVGAVKIVMAGERILVDGDQLYSDRPDRKEPCQITLVPYFAWGNRGPGEMRVWLGSC